MAAQHLATIFSQTEMAVAQPGRLAFDQLVQTFQGDVQEKFRRRGRPKVVELREPDAACLPGEQIVGSQIADMMRRMAWGFNGFHRPRSELSGIDQSIGGDGADGSVACCGGSEHLLRAFPQTCRINQMGKGRAVANDGH